MTDTPAGYEAARSGAAFFDVADGGRFRLAGPDGPDFLHRMVTNEVQSLAPGRGVYAAMLDINGRMIADLYAWRTDAETLLLETAASAQDALMAALDKYLIMEDAEIVDARAALALITVQGPGAHDAVQTALGISLPALEEGECWTGDSRLGEAIVGRRDRSEEGGRDVYVPAEQMASLRDALRDAGAEEGEAAALEILRIEAGIPKWGHDLDATVIPLEANLQGRGLSFTRGCYPGQEIIARIHARGAPARRLAGIRFPEGAPMAGAEVVSDGASIGRITSAALSPTLGGLALAYLKRDTAAPGEAVTVENLTGVVVGLPFSDAAPATTA